MKITVKFYSYFRELTGCAHLAVDLPDHATLGELITHLQQRYPKLVGMQKSTLMAVGVEYQRADYKLIEGDEVSLFPPVQGG